MPRRQGSPAPNRGRTLRFVRTHPALAFACFLFALGCLEGALQLQGGGARALLGVGLCLQGLWLGLALAGALMQRRPVALSLGLRSGRLGWGSLAVGAVGLVALSGALHELLSLVALRETGSLARIDQGIRESTSGPRSLLLLTVVSIGIAPAIGEELLFRGLVQRWLAARWRPLLAVAAAALLFGAVHADPVHGPAAFLLGLYLGWIAHLAGSIRPAVGLHLVNNLLGVAAVTLPSAALPGGPARGLVLLAVAVGALAWVTLRAPAVRAAPGARARP